MLLLLIPHPVVWKPPSKATLVLTTTRVLSSKAWTAFAPEIELQHIEVSGLGFRARAQTLQGFPSVCARVVQQESEDKLNPTFKSKGPRSYLSQYPEQNPGGLGSNWG